MFNKFRQRSSAVEIIDDLSIKGEVLQAALDNLKRINRWLGGHMVVRSGLRQILRSKALVELIKANKQGQRPLTIADAACGGGDALQLMAQLAKEEGLALQLIGLDANAATIEYARKANASFPEIRFSKQDILSESCKWEGIDILCCSQFLYHLSYEELKVFLQRCLSQGVKAILINDLQRHWLPYYLFQVLCFVFRAPAVIRLDGSVAIRKGFIRKELLRLMQDAGFKQYQLRWRWAFRYQLIIYNN